MTMLTRRMNACCTPRSTNGGVGFLSDVDQVFGEFFRTIPAIAPVSAPSKWPALNIREDDAGFVVEADVPGLTMENLDVTFENGDLTIRGERAETKEESGVNYHRRERTSGAFERTIRLGAEVDPATVDATLEHGVLRVTLPRSEASKSRKIQVRAK